MDRRDFLASGAVGAFAVTLNWPVPALAEGDDALLESFESQMSRCWAHLEVDAAELAFEVACRVLGDAAGRRRLIEDMVAQAMSGLRGQTQRVRLSAADLALIDEAEAGTAGLRSRYPGIEWVADPMVQAGGCLIDGEGGTLDARLILVSVVGTLFVASAGLLAFQRAERTFADTV